MDLCKNLLVGIDFSENSRNALLQGLRLAREGGCRVQALHIVESDALRALAEASKDAPGLVLSGSAREATERFHALLKEVGSTPEEVAFDVRMGDPLEVMLEHIDRLKVDLLILGARGRTSKGDEAGTLTSHCIRLSKADVLVVRQRHTTAYAHITVFVDLSRHSRGVIEHAVEIARRDRSRLEICHVFLPPWKVVHYGAAPRVPSAEKQARYRDKILTKLRSSVEPFADRVAGLEVGFELVEGSQKIVAIDEFIKERGADLVVVHTRSRRGMRVLLMRTVAEHIIRTSPCSVLAIKT